MGKVLGFKEDYLFWEIVRQLSVQYDYRMITVTENHEEIWLESDKNKEEFPIIRLIRHDLDWANWLKRDIDRTLKNGEQIRKKLYKKPISIVSIYVSEFSPVDDFEFSLQPAVLQKTKVNTFIFACENLSNSKQKLEDMLHKSLPISVPNDEEIEEEQVLQLKKTAIAASVKKAKAEQKVFQNAKPFFTYILLAIQVAVFILMEFSGGSTDSKTLIEFGAKYSPYILQGEWWRFFTPMFIHIGFVHLLMNSFSLYLIGAEVERIYGNARFLFIYIFAGFAGTLGSFIMTPNLSAGASGAIFGCFGALLYFGIVYPKLFMRSMGSSIFVLIAINLIYGFSVPGIDNAGHIGGLVGGFLAAGVVHLPKTKSLLRQMFFLLGTSVLTYFLLQFGYTHQNNDDETMAMLAQDYMNDGEEAKAEEMLSNYVDGNSDAPISHFILGNLAFDNEDFEQARYYFEQAIEQNPELHEAHYNLALSYAKLELMDEAKEQAQKAVELAPKEKSYQELLEELK